MAQHTRIAGEYYRALMRRYPVDSGLWLAHIADRPALQRAHRQARRGIGSRAFRLQAIRWLRMSAQQRGSKP